MTRAAVIKIFKAINAVVIIIRLVKFFENMW